MMNKTPQSGRFIFLWFEVGRGVAHDIVEIPQIRAGAKYKIGLSHSIHASRIDWRQVLR